MKKLHVAVSVTFENKSIQAKSGDRPAAEGIDLIAAFKRSIVMTILGWGIRKVFDFFFGSDDSIE